MKSENARDGTKEVYSAPRILASYDKEALEESLQPHGGDCTGGLCDGGGCGCGCGCGA
jgi:hypothetical protein